MKKDNLLAYNIQFFGEAEGGNSQTENDNNEGQEQNQPTLEEQFQALLVENAKLKKSFDKAASDAADFKKKYNSTLSQQQQADIEKAEREAIREEEFQNLRRENQVNKFAKNFLMLGYTEELATKAAEAQYDGDTDTLFKIQQDIQAALIKKKEEEWIKSRPEIEAGVGEDGVSITKEQFKKMGYAQRVQFKAKYPETYKKYVEQ